MPVTTISVSYGNSALFVSFDLTVRLTPFIPNDLPILRILQVPTMGDSITE